MREIFAFEGLYSAAFELPLHFDLRFTESWGLDVPNKVMSAPSFAVVRVSVYTAEN